MRLLLQLTLLLLLLLRTSLPRIYCLHKSKGCKDWSHVYLKSQPCFLACLELQYTGALLALKPSLYSHLSSHSYTLTPIPSLTPLLSRP